MYRRSCQLTVHRLQIAASRLYHSLDADVMPSSPNTIVCMTTGASIPLPSPHSTVPRPVQINICIPSSSAERQKHTRKARTNKLEKKRWIRGGGECEERERRKNFGLVSLRFGAACPNEWAQAGLLSTRARHSCT